MGSSPPHVRFCVTLYVACTFASVQLLMAVVLCRPTSFYNPLAWFTIVYIFLVQQWNRLYGGHLSRKCRTLFDEWNVMETYQPRALTMGHLFEPEPPTPCPDNKKISETDQFKAMRDAHYANEFTYVQKMEAERKAMEAASTTAPNQGAQQTSSNIQSECTRIELKDDHKSQDQDSYREI
ncbi:hypothetical protein RB195_008284 [Necator americanus]|uniref:Transmembrane protein n=1 Tax=Necator americanus TaxID=51031 RepID=A0ABR1CMX3_NECAM